MDTKVATVVSFWRLGGLMRRTSTPVIPLLVLVVGGAVGGQGDGVIIAPEQGESYIFCRAPELRVTVKVDRTTGSANAAMGTAQVIRGTNIGTHPEDDEIIYFLRGTGSVIVGDKTTLVQPGMTVFIPKGVRHGFANPSDEPLEFVWTNVPGKLAERFAANGKKPGEKCP